MEKWIYKAHSDKTSLKQGCRTRGECWGAAAAGKWRRTNSMTGQRKAVGKPAHSLIWLDPKSRAGGHLLKPLVALKCCLVTPPKIYTTLCKLSLNTQFKVNQHAHLQHDRPLRQRPEAHTMIASGKGWETIILLTYGYSNSGRWLLWYPHIQTNHCQNWSAKQQASLSSTDTPEQ